MERRESHLRVFLARLSVGRGAVTGTPIPRRVIACRFQRHALSPRVSPLCNVDCAVYTVSRRNTTAFRPWIRAVMLGNSRRLTACAEFPTREFK